MQTRKTYNRSIATVSAPLIVVVATFLATDESLFDAAVTPAFG